MYSSNYPVFINEPHLRDLEQFMLTDMGTHILDVARFLFGEASLLYCQTRRVDPGIKGEDVATVMMEMGGVTVTCEMSYASRLEHASFPQVCILVECDNGSVELALDYWIRVTTEAGHARAAGASCPGRAGWTRCITSCRPASWPATGTCWTASARAGRRRPRAPTT